MPFEKGAPAHPKSGRPKGRINEATKVKDQLHLDTIQAIEEGIKSGQLTSPLSFLMGVYENEEHPLAYRIQAAKECTKYLHAAKPTEVRQTISNDDKTFEINFVDKS